MSAVPTQPQTHIAVLAGDGIGREIMPEGLRVLEAAARYPDVAWDKQHIDMLCARFVLQPERFDVVAAINLFGDILSDLGPAACGTIGIAPSANLNPERRWPSLFEPMHGSAPDIAGRGIANPIAIIWSDALMLDSWVGAAVAMCVGAAHTTPSWLPSKPSRAKARECPTSAAKPAPPTWAAPWPRRWLLRPETP